MNNLDKIKLTISARDSHGQYGMYREVEDREKYLSIKITERAKNLLNTSDINACALDCRIHYKNDDTKVTLSTLVDVEDSTTRKEVLERIIKALECYGTRHGMFRFPLAVIDENGKIIHKNPSLQEYPVSGYQFLLNKLEGRIYSAACEYVFTRDIYERIGGFVKFPLAWCSDDATWTSIGENAGGMIPLPGKPVCWRNVMGENISCSFNYDEEKIVATRQFIKWVSVFYSDRLQDRKLQHAIKKYAHTILHYSLQDRYKLHDLMGICRSLWYICPSVSLSVAFRMCKLKLRNRKR